ncbi:SDR family oxidoreductase [Caenimonas sp. SL110]|uniref:SDR family oxidoreductase n=1 Tax=Caenimonas sp. SL110 TaxID=1450524 RepID=UPI0006532ED6|nr:SDR family oxidoreductase [Caenimonas sp. SL110]
MTSSPAPQEFQPPTGTRLQGKTVLVTAAGQGIGRACALAMAAQGAQVWATDVNESLLGAYQGVVGVKALRLDVLDKAAITALVAQMPAVNAVFNCAGYVHSGTILQATDDDWNFALNLNARSQFWTIQAVLPRMIAAGGGSIINMASVCSSIRGLPNRFIYGMSKAAVIGLTKSVAADFIGQGIRCNAIAPGTVDTPSLHDRINANPDPVAARAAFVARQPMGRLAQAHEMAPLVVFLASDESVFVTGQTYAADGGMTI